MIARRLLMGGGGSFPDWTRGTLTPDGSPATVLADGNQHLFPGVAKLTATTCLLVWRRIALPGTVGQVYGSIGTITGYTVSWGAPFPIYSNAQDVLLEDAVEVIGDKIVIAARLYNGTVNHSPFLITANLAGFTSASTWSSPISIPLTEGTSENLCIGRVRSLQTGTYMLGWEAVDTGAGFQTYNGVLLSASLTDWSAMTVVTIGALHANEYSEIDIEELPDGSLYAHLRTEIPLQFFGSGSSDHGATWAAPASLFSAHGLPSWRRLPTGIRLTVYRRVSDGHTSWRQSANNGATWSSETLLDGTLIAGQASISAYATFLSFDATHTLCVYSIVDADFINVVGNLYSQVFTDSSTR